MMEFGTNNYEFKIYEKVLKWAVDIVLVITIAVFVGLYVGKISIMSGNSMNSVISNDDKLLVDMVSYNFKKPSRFDIIEFSTDNGEHTYIKRVIGLPGETVEIKSDGLIYIDGQVLKENENYTYEKIVNSGIAKKPVTLSDNEYFVLGDNRNNSEDSRFDEIGNVKKKDIIGKVWFRVSPVNAFGFIE